MTRERFLAAPQVGHLVTTLLGAGVKVYGPVVEGGRSEYRPITAPERLDLQASLPALPLKALFLPPSEVLFTWRRQHNDVTLTPVAPAATPTVVIGARPCDVAGVEVLDKVMGWDYRDENWFSRREATTIVALACPSKGPDCFCDAVGLGPASSKGADVLLTARGEGYDALALTDKGLALFEKCGGCFGERAGAEAPAPTAGLKPRPTAATATTANAATAADAAGGTGAMAVVQQWLAAHFNDPLWAQIGLRCHGCGACASVCPTCHCFDIVDEPDGLLAGARRRNWDACQSSKFTLHASGHNPRGDQNTRFRQRVLHKFSIYPQRFGEVLCTGCGRCAQACPAGQNLPEILDQVTRAARGEAGQ